MFGQLRTVFQKRSLVHYLALSQEEKGLFKTALGRAWMFLDPLALVAAYYFVFVIIFQAGPRFGVNPFVFIFTGIVHYYILNRAIQGAGSSILSNDALLLRIRIDPLVFVAVSAYKTVREHIPLYVFYVVAYVALGPDVQPRLAWYPLLLLELLVLSWSGSILLATLAVFFRDMLQIVRVVFRVGIYLLPIMYSIEIIPPNLREIYLYNPLACLFALIHWSMLGGPMPPTGPVISLGVFTVVLVFGANLLYERTNLKFTKVF